MELILTQTIIVLLIIIVIIRIYLHFSLKRMSAFSKYYKVYLLIRCEDPLNHNVEEVWKRFDKTYIWDYNFDRIING